MPYSSLEEAKGAGFPTTAEGIPLTLAQVNRLAEIHDAVKAAGDAGNPMAVAWTQWKREYKKEGSEWVKAEQSMDKGSSSFVSPFNLTHNDGWSPKIVKKDGMLIVEGARIFKANTPMKHEMIYTPEELKGAVKGPLLFDIDHNYLAIGEQDKLLKAYMDEKEEYLLGDLQFESPTLQKLVEDGAINGVSVVTQWNKTQVHDGKKYAKGVTIPAISLTEIPFCGKGGNVEGCGITHNLMSGAAPMWMPPGQKGIGSCRHSGCGCSGTGAPNIGGDKVTKEEDLKEQVSELTKEIERLKGGTGDKGIDLEHKEVREHVKEEVDKAIHGIDLAGKLKEAVEKIGTGEHSDDKLTEVLDEVKKGAVDAYTAEKAGKAVEAKKAELLKDIKCEHAKAVIKELSTMDALDAFEKAQDTSQHRLSTEGDGVGNLAQLQKEFNAKLGMPIKEEVK